MAAPTQRRVAIVTGASSGIGRALAEWAARCDADVLAVGRRGDRLADLERACLGLPGRIATRVADVRDASAAAAIVADAVARFGRIDVLVNNAGGVAVGPIVAQSEAALREQFETHVYAPLALTRHALPALRASRGHIFFIGSGVARVPVSGLGAYPAAKAAVRSLARIVRADVRGDGIAVTYVDPGAVDTEFMTRAGMAPAPRSVLASPHTVARRIWGAVATRPRVLNAVPWQTATVALAEFAPALVDALLARAPQLVGGEATALAAPPDVAIAADAALAAPPAAPEERAGGDDFERALAPLARSMERAKLRPKFVRALLVPERTLDLGEVALAWAGMPNKHERAITRDVLEALVDAGFLRRAGEDRYDVVRAAARADHQ